MKPYFDNGTVAIYHADFRDVIPLGFDQIITDPPYNIGFSQYDIYSDDMVDDEYIEMISIFQNKRVALIQYPEEHARLITPALGPALHYSFWCYNQNTPRRVRQIGYWKRIPDYSRIKQPYKNPTDKRVAQLIANGSSGTDLYEWWIDIQIVKNVSSEKNEHPCPIPEDLAERIIMLTTDPGETVFDPFCGGGTILYAAQKLGRKAIGCELSERYCEVAANRVGYGVLLYA